MVARRVGSVYFYYVYIMCNTLYVYKYMKYYNMHNSNICTTVIYVQQWYMCYSNIMVARGVGGVSPFICFPPTSPHSLTPWEVSEKCTSLFWLSRMTNSWFRNKLRKWLQSHSWVKKMLNLHPSVWKFARRWLASHCPSPSPSTLGPTSPSPWTPGGKKSWHPSRRRKRPHQPWDEMPGGEKSFWRRSSMLQLLRKLSSVTNVTTPSNRKVAWRSTLENPTRTWTQPQLHRTSWGSS